MPSDHLTVLGIRPVEWSLRPAGLHLRWMFPVRHGFPPGGFQLFRRLAKRADPPCVDLTVDKDRALTSGTAIGGVTLHVHANVVLRGTGGPELAVESTPLPGTAEPFLLRMAFDGPAVAVEVRVRGPISGASIVLRAHDPADRVVAQATIQAEAGSRQSLRLRVEAPLIDHATLGLDFAVLERLCVQTHARVCAEDWGQPVKDLPLLEAPVTRATLADRLGDDVRNAHAADLPAALGRYGPGADELLRWLRALVHGDPTRIRNHADPPPLRRAVARRARSPLRAVYPQAMLLLAALDANVARLLSLGWVDRFRGPGEDPERGRAYDYKVVGRWRSYELCGLRLGLGGDFSPRPTLPPEASAVVLAGVRWEGTEPHRRVGVRWRRPPVPNAEYAAVAPVLYQVRRAREVSASPSAFGPAEDRTGRRPAIVPVASWETPLGVRYVDPETPLGTYRYSVSGIDLFGQASALAVAPPVQVRDDEAPPPPVRVSASVSQPGYPWLRPEQRALATSTATCAVRFEYGAWQLRRAPDAATFSLFWRSRTLVDAEPMTLRLVARTPAKGDRHRLVVEVLQTAPGNAARFERAVVMPRWTAAVLPPAAARPRLRVVAVETEGVPRPRLHLAPSATDIDLPDAPETFAATVRLDRRRREGWREVPGISVPVRAPIAGVLARNAGEGDVMEVRVRAIEAPPAPLLLPEHAPGDLRAPIAGYDVFIDRALLEANLFRTGAADASGAALAILSSTAGRAAVDGTPEGLSGAARVRLGLDEMIALAPGDTLTLPVGVTAGQQNVRAVEMRANAGLGDLPAPGGELAFDAELDGGKVLVTAAVVSDVERAGQRLRFLVRFPDSLPSSTWPRAEDPVRYFPPYVVPALSVGLDAGASLQLPIDAGEGAAIGYLAVGATDVRGLRSRLSAPVPIAIVRPPPAPPPPPFPCGAPSAPEGFATLPDRQGRATLCVGWTPPPSVATLRFEVARALDQTIVAADLRGWLTGRSAPGLPPLPVRVTSIVARSDGTLEVRADQVGTAGIPDVALAGGLLWQGNAGFPLTGAIARISEATVSFVVAAAGAPPVAGAADLYPVPVPPRPALTAEVLDQSFDAERGLHRVTVGGAGGASLASAPPLGGGCLVQGAQRFQITFAGMGMHPELLVRRVAGAGDPITGDACALEPPPDYAAVAGRPDKIRLLADKPGNEDAFGLATGVPVLPVSATEFRDEIAGLGTAPFFYRVRAVDPAENRSAWSGTSVPFWPVDTTSPPAPGPPSVTAGDRTATLVWPRSGGPVSRYHVLRVVGRAAPFGEPASQAPYAILGPGDVGLGPLRVVAGGLVLPRPLRFEVDGGLALPDIAARLLEWIRVAPVGAAPEANLVDPTASRAIFTWAPTGDGTLRVAVTALAGLGAIAPDVPVAVSAGSEVIDGDPSVWSWTDHGLSGGTTYAYRLVAVKSVRAAPAAPGGDPRELHVPSAPSAPVSVVALDRRPVAAPAIVSAAWADTASGPATAIAVSLQAAADAPAAVRIERRASAEGAWEIASLESGWGWTDWPPAATQATVIVTRAGSSPWWELRAAVRLADGRVSPPSAAVAVS